MKNRNRMIVNCVTASLMYYWSLPALAEQSSSEIKIVRDEYGMPHIYANDTWHLFYGYGYVVAQDRLFQMEMARRSTQGTVAEVLGKDFVKFGRAYARKYFREAEKKKAEIKEQREILTAEICSQEYLPAELHNKLLELVDKVYPKPLKIA